MLVQDPLSGYLHEVPDPQPHYGGYGGYGGGYYGGYDEYVDPSMAEYPGELGHLGLLIPHIIRAMTRKVGLPTPPLSPLSRLLPLSPLAPLSPLSQLLPLLQQTTTPAPAPGFAPPPPMMHPYFAAMLRDALARSTPGVNPAFSQGGIRRRRRRRR
jgi:hypothetical protein